MPPKKTTSERVTRQGHPEEHESDSDDRGTAGAAVHEDDIARPAALTTHFDAEHFVATFMRSFAQAQTEVNRNLVETLRSTTLADSRSSATATPTSNASGAAAALPGNFSRCTARFDARTRDPEVLEAFLDAVETYKECTAVSDEHAIRGLSMLLEGEAAVWWRGIKTSVTTWRDAVERLRAMYGAPRPGYELLREMYAVEHQEERAEAFICRLRALIVRLPYSVPEAMQVDIIYGLLHRRIRKRLLRDDIDSVNKLLDKARVAEDGIRQVSQTVPIPIVSATTANDDAARARASSEKQFSASSEGSIPCANDKSKEQKRNRVRCSYCKIYGHGVDECRNLHSESKNTVGSNANEVSEPSTSNGKGSETIRCYGCGKQGVVRSKCDSCNTSKRADFNFSDDINLEVVSSHPMVAIGFLGREGVAIVDTGATHCIASPMLHKILVVEGVSFENTRRSLRMADGSQQLREVLTADVPVTLEGRSFMVDFMVIPGCKTRTLLGFEFVSRAGMVLDGSQDTWSFADDPGHQVAFVRKYQLSSAEDTELMRVEVSDSSPRSVKGSRFLPNQRSKLNIDMTGRVVRKTAEGASHAHYRGRRLTTCPRDCACADGVLLRRHHVSQHAPFCGEVAVKKKRKRGRPPLSGVVRRVSYQRQGSIAFRPLHPAVKL